MPRPSSTGFALALIASFAFGVLPIFGKYAFAEGFDVVTLLTWRFSIGALLMWTASLVRDRGRTITGRRRLELLAIGGLYGVNAAFYFMALERIPATTASLIFYVYPAVVALLAMAFLKVRLRRLELAALALALLGVALTVGFAKAPLDTVGVAFALLSAGVIAGYMILSEVALAGVPILPATAIAISGTALAYWGVQIVGGRLGMPPSGLGWVIVLAMGTISTALSMLALLAAIHRLGAATTAIVLTLEPAVTAALAASLLGERLAERQYVGGAVILTGVLLLRWGGRVPQPGPVDV